MDIRVFLSLLIYLATGFAVFRYLFKENHPLKLLVLGLPFGFAAFVLGTGIWGRLLQNFELSLQAGALSCLIFHLIFAKHLWTSGFNWRMRLKWKPWDIATAFLCLGSTVLITCISLKYSFHDELSIQSHLSVIERILQGPFPPSFIAFPEVAFRYHYGFNLLAAVFCRAFGLEAPRGVDMVTILSWVALWSSLLYFLFLKRVPRKAFCFAMAFILLSGGFSYFLAPAEAGMVGAHFQAPHWQQMFFYRRYVQPHFISYFFQHPMGLGFPLFFSICSCLHAWWKEHRNQFLLAVALLSGALSLVQLMLFLTVLAVLGLVFLHQLIFQRERFQTLWFGLMIAAIALGLAFLLGGFFSSIGAGGSGDFPLRFTWLPGYLRNEYYGASVPIGFWKSFLWYLSSFGWVLFFAPWAWLKAFRRSDQIDWFLAIFSILGFFIPQFFQYRYSWDIIKWFVAFDIGAKTLIAAMFFPIWVERKWTFIAMTVLIALSMVAPFRFLAELSFKDFARMTLGEKRIASNAQFFPPKDLTGLIAKMKSCSECRGMVYSTPATSLSLALSTGYPMLQMDYNSYAMPVPKEKIAQRQRDLKKLETDPNLSLIQQLGIRWVVFRCSEWNRLPPKVRGFFEKLKSSLRVADFGEILKGRSDMDTCVYAILILGEQGNI